MARNFGQHPATIAGILYSSGDWVVTLDEDLQHPPEKIDDLLLKVAQQSFDIVYAKAEGSVHENYLRDFGSILYKRAIETLTGNSNVRHFNSFRLIRGSVARAAGSVCGHDTYFDVALSWFTQRVGVASMPLKDNRVISGKKSGYRFSKLLSHARRMLMSSGTKVVRLGGAAGLLIVVGSLFSAAIITFRKIFYPETIVVDGWTSLMLAVVFFGGAAAFLMGIVLEYLSMLVINAHGKPIFFTVDRSSDADLAKHFHVEKT
jgi:undecaprenyl-phosphate 4-deoxy-4-formamido-L-arabinose transferase